MREEHGGLCLHFCSTLEFNEYVIQEISISRGAQKDILKNGPGAALADLTVNHPVEEMQKRVKYF